MCLIAMNIAKLFFKKEMMQFTSVVGGIFHNLGQLLAAVIITENVAVVWYAPALMLGGIVCGYFTGIACKLVFKRLETYIR